MRVLAIVHDAIPFSMGGVEVYVDRVSRSLARAGVEVEVLASVDPGARNTYEMASRDADGVRLTTLAHRTGRDRFHMLRLARDFSAFDRNPRVDACVLAVVRARRPDVVHVHHLVHLSASVIETLAKEGIPVVVTLHDYWWLCVAGQLLNEEGPHEAEECGGACFRYLLKNRHKASGALRGVLETYARARDGWFTRFVRSRQAYMVGQLQKARLVLALSHDLARRYVGAGLDPSRVVVCDYGTERAGIVRRKRSGEGPVRFGFVGRIVPEKGLHLLVAAFARLGAGTRASLEVFGSGGSAGAAYEKALRTRASQGVHFHGPFENAGVSRVLDALDVLVVPSIWWENSPIVIHEAFAAGLPVVTARAGGMQELVSDGASGLLFRLGDAEDLSHALARMLEPGALAALSSGVPSPKSMEENVDELIGHYRTLSGEAAGAPPLLVAGLRA